MSGLDGLQAATSVITLVELAVKTASFIRRAARARKDALELANKTQNLADLIAIIHQQLAQRNIDQASPVDSEQNVVIVRQIRTTLSMCETSLEEICKTFQPLVEESSKKSFYDSFKFAHKQGYIATQERTISTYLAMLSVGLQCLLRQDQTRMLERNDPEAQREMQAAFLRQLFELFRFMFTNAPQTEASSGNQVQQATASQPAQIGQQNVLAIESGEALTIESLIGHPGDPEIVLPVSEFEEARVVEEVGSESLEDTKNGGVTSDPVKDEISQIRQGEPSKIEKSSEETTLLLAIKQGSTAIVRKLVSEGTDITAIDVYGWTLLHHAAFFLREEITDILLNESECQQPQILNAQTHTGETALIYAVQRAGKESGYKIAMNLLSHKCDIDIDDGRGTAFFYAVNQGRPGDKKRQSLVESLAENGADVNAMEARLPEEVACYPVLRRYLDSVESDPPTTRQRRFSTLRRMLSGSTEK